MKNTNARVRDPEFIECLRALQAKSTTLSSISRGLAAAGYVTATGREFSCAYIGYCLRVCGLKTDG